MNSRQAALNLIQKRMRQEPAYCKKVTFAEEVFQIEAMRKFLPADTIAHLKEVMAGSVQLNALFADSIAEAMKCWAQEKGATHFCHWFQPLTGLAAEKHDAFFDGQDHKGIIEKFSGKQLLRGEPDASSFPHGGLRSTFAARGYTTWDPTSAPFLRELGDSKVLCLPSVFFSWKGDALDYKIPLMRSEDKIKIAGMRLLSLFDQDVKEVFSTLGCEQEYFLIDRAYYLLRPDLMLSGRTLIGNSPAKGQELEEFYFSPIKKRVASFMVDLERRSLSLGIPLKTRHAEVAPGQFEWAPVFEKSSLAVDHNVLLMELMQEVATSHNLVCLLHEKPFARVNGSGKHCNWSLSTDTGMNLLDPKGPQLLFLTLLTAIVHAVYEKGSLLRASIATAGNDHRLGGNEAPPAIISVYLGESLERWLSSVEEAAEHLHQEGQSLDLKIPPIPSILLDEADRNRTSAFAFTGNKFEFRAVGASQHCAVPLMVLNAIVAESLHRIIDEIKKEEMNKKPLQECILNVIRNYLKLSKPVRFSGDNYSSSWREEVKRRKLPLIEKSVHAFEEWLTPASLKVFEGVLSKNELESRVEIFYERYCKTLAIESRLVKDLFQTKILPAALQYQKEVAKSLKLLGETGHTPPLSQLEVLKKISTQIAQAIESIRLLEKVSEAAEQGSLEKNALIYCDSVAPQLQAAREFIDELESILDDSLWPLPKYQEMLYIL